jgi:hypothetical protein
MPICTRCGFRNVEGARFCGNCGAQVSAVAIPNPLVWTGALPPPVLQKPGISRAVWRFIGLGSAIAVGIFILLVIIGTLLPSAPNQSNASQPSAPTLEIQGSAPTQKDSAPTPEEDLKAKQLNLGIRAMTAQWDATPVVFHEREKLRFDAVTVMPDDTVCLWVHIENSELGASAIPGVNEPNASFLLGKNLFPVTTVTFDLWTRECTDKQRGINVLPELEDNANQLQQKMNDLNQQLHDAQ